MKVFFDTSVLISSVLADHEYHARAFAALERVQRGVDEGIVAGHSLVEMFAVLTRLPLPFRHSPEQAHLSIEENVVAHFALSSLTGREYVALVKEAALAGISGGTVYDAVLMKAADNAGVERIYTFNIRHFQAVAPKSLIPIISTP
jgi:predicted nucleic acid-binding protein